MDRQFVLKALSTDFGVGTEVTVRVLAAKVRRGDNQTKTSLSAGGSLITEAMKAELERESGVPT